MAALRDWRFWAFLVLALVVAWGFMRVNDTINDIAREGATREDQFCLLTERDHRDDVRQLRQTYEYVLDLTPDERNVTINRLVLRELPRTEREAAVDSAPPICDEPGRYGDKNVGLPEPDPKIPKRPKAVDELLKGS